MDYTFVYTLRNIKPTLDGSGMVLNDVEVRTRPEGSSDEYTPVPGRHKDIACPAAEVVEAIQGPGVKAKYLAMLSSNLNRTVQPNTGWDMVSLEALMDANDEVADAIVQFNAFLVSIGQTLPYDF